MADEEIQLQVGVKVLIENRRGEFLLIHRNAEKYPGVADAWDIPGGRIEPGSRLLENLAREVREETNLVLQGVPELLAAQDIQPPGKHVVRLTYKGHARGNIKLDTAENDEFKWVRLSEMRRMKGLDTYLKTVILKHL